MTEFQHDVCIESDFHSRTWEFHEVLIQRLQVRLIGDDGGEVCAARQSRLEIDFVLRDIVRGK